MFTFAHNELALTDKRCPQKLGVSMQTPALSIADEIVARKRKPTDERERKP